MTARDPLPAIVAVAIIGLLVAVVLFVPSYPPAPAATVGTLPLGVSSFRPSLDGTYYAPCRGGTLPIRWAVFLYQSNRPNTTFHLSGAWNATEPTSVEFGFSVNLTSTDVLRNWMPFAHCPLLPPNYTPPNPPTRPTLPTSGSVDYDITTLPDATLFLLMVRTFDPSDVVQVTEPFTMTPP